MPTSGAPLSPLIGSSGCRSQSHSPLIGHPAAALRGTGTAPIGCLWWGCGVADPAGSARTMGTRDDEYDYLFKGMVAGVQTGERAAANRWAEAALQAAGPQLEPGAWGPAGQAAGKTMAGRVRSALGRDTRPYGAGGPEGPEGPGCAEAGPEPRGVGSQSGGSGR